MLIKDNFSFLFFTNIFSTYFYLWIGSSPLNQRIMYFSAVYPFISSFINLRFLKWELSRGSPWATPCSTNSEIPSFWLKWYWSRKELLSSFLLTPFVSDIILAIECFLVSCSCYRTWRTLFFFSTSYCIGVISRLRVSCLLATPCAIFGKERCLTTISA